MIEKNQFHLQKKGVNDILIKWDSEGLKGAKIGVNHMEVPYHLQIWECPTPGGQPVNLSM